jgi:hypothetical protein
MPAWDILLRLASAPGWREPSYGGGGGPVAGNPMGTATLPTSNAWNCSTFQAKATIWGAYYLGREGFSFSVSDWSEWMIQELGAAGGVDVAVRLGLAPRVVHGLPRGLKPGSWVIAQGWNGSRGHASFLRFCRNEDGRGFSYLEANNGFGVNGIGSRSCSVPNARNWGGTWPEGSLTLEPAEAILDRYETFYSAVLS